MKRNLGKLIFAWRKGIFLGLLFCIFLTAGSHVIEKSKYNNSIDISSSNIFIFESWEQTGGAIYSFLDLLFLFGGRPFRVVEPFFGHSDRHPYSAINGLAVNQGLLPILDILDKKVLFSDLCFPEVHMVGFDEVLVGKLSSSNFFNALLIDYNQVGKEVNISGLNCIAENQPMYQRLVEELPFEISGHTCVGSHKLDHHSMVNTDTVIMEWRGLCQEDGCPRVYSPIGVGRSKVSQCVKLSNSLIESMKINDLDRAFGAIHIRLEWFATSSNQTMYDMAKQGDIPSLNKYREIILMMIDKIVLWISSNPFDNYFLLADIFDGGSSTGTGILAQFQKHYNLSVSKFILESLSPFKVARPVIGSKTYENRAILALADMSILNRSAASIRFGHSSLTRIFAPADQIKHVLIRTQRDLLL